MPKKNVDCVRASFEGFFSRYPVDRSTAIVVALSGGSDSVALLLSAADYFGKENVTAAHFNHRLRGDESDTDARFCEELCKKLGVRFESKEEDVLAFSKERKTGIEDAARTLRYAFLKTIASRIGASCILTGHTADDLAETVLANFLRWAKLRWWQGIPERTSEGICRPFLELRKKVLLAYLESQSQDYRTDSSNEDPSYLRNRIRNRIIPEIETFNPGFTTTALRFAEYAAELDAHLETEVTEYLESEEEPETLEIARFATLSPFLKKDILSRLYVRKNSSGIGLSEGMVAEMLRFCSMKYGGKAKVFGKLELTRKKGKISYRKNREA